jgi:predicted transcriptional regulator
MGLTKTDNFTKKQNELAILAKAFGHPARIAIIEYLTRAQSCVCGDIVNELPLSQSTVSQHLKELKSAGLIKGTIEGPSVCYCINNEVWQAAKVQFESLFSSFRGEENYC